MGQSHPLTNRSERRRRWTGKLGDRKRVIDLKTYREKR
jgi:hypothetical protein